MKERAIEFGLGLNLIGILAEPMPADARPELPAVLMLNAGFAHRVGPHRMSVELARRLAARGFRSLRFDIGGRGDSESMRETESDESQVLADIKDAMDYLESNHDIRRFVLVGLCAGADNAHAAAVRDARVVGAVLLDGYGYWTLRSYVMHYLPRLGRPRAWLNYLLRVLSPSRKAAEEFRLHWRRKPFGPRLEVQREIQALVDRNTQLLYIYTGGVYDYYNYSGQFGDMFDGLDARGKIEVEYYANADHTYVFAEDRERMLSRVVEWCCSRAWNAR